MAASPKDNAVTLPSSTDRTFVLVDDQRDTLSPPVTVAASW